MKRSVVEERMAKVLASRVGFKKKFPDSSVAQERFAFNKMWIERSSCLCKENGCDWDRKKKGKGLCAQPIALGCRYILLGLNMSTILRVSARVSNRRGRDGELRSRKERIHSRLITTVRAQAREGELSVVVEENRNGGVTVIRPNALMVGHSSPIILNVTFFCFSRLLWLISVWFFINPDLSSQPLFHLPRMNIFRFPRSFGCLTHLKFYFRDLNPDCHQFH